MAPPPLFRKNNSLSQPLTHDHPQPPYNRATITAPPTTANTADAHPARAAPAVTILVGFGAPPVMVELPDGQPGAVHLAVAVGRAVARVVGLSPWPHWTHTLGPGAPEVQAGTTWVVRSVGGSGVTVTVTVWVLLPLEGQLASPAEQLTVLRTVKVPVVSGQTAVVMVTTSVVTLLTGQWVTVGGHEVMV